MPTRIILLAVLSLALPAWASAQDLTESDRGEALSRVRSLASCVERENAALQRVVRLIDESQTQSRRGRDAAARRDAESALEALVARAAEIQQRARACLGEDLPSPGTEVIVRDAPLEGAAASVAQTGGTVRTVEQDVELTGNVHVVRGEQVDGEGRMDATAVRDAFHSIAPRLQRCYASYLQRGSIAPRELDLVFAFGGSGQATQVDIERSGFSDARFEQCVRQAGHSLHVSRGPSGGAAMFSYRLRFGR